MSDSPEQYWTDLGHANFFYTAERNCALVDHYRPDLIIGLAHGGMLSVKVAETAWRVMDDRPFPPILYTNLGREKINYYEDWREAHGMHPRFQGEASPLDDILHFLDWLRSREDWQDELLHQIEATLGPGVEPGVIMVIDEMCAQQNTLMLTLGLLEILYPMAETHFVDGPYFQWREELGKLWLTQHHPEVLTRMMDEQERQPRKDSGMGALYRIMSGTEDIDPVSLSFRPLTSGNEDVRLLAAYLPVEAWLAIPGQAEAEVLNEIAGLAAQSNLTEARTAVNWDYLRRISRLAPYLLLRHLGRFNQITLAEAARILGTEEAEVREVMENLVRHTRYAAQYGDRIRVVDVSPTRSGLTYHFIEEPEIPEPPARESKGQRAKAKEKAPRPKPRRK